MIYPYTYFDHRIQKFHQGLVFFFTQMFRLDLEEYDENQLLEEEFRILVRKSPARLEAPLKEIVKLYKLIEGVNDKRAVKEAFENNNNIEELCRGLGNPKKFEELPDLIKDKIFTFWRDLWEDFSHQDSLNTHVKDLCGGVLEHFHEFKKLPTQGTKVCPFCGINGLKPGDDIRRNDYDHYLPKSLYPFIAVNFNNLVPLCDGCNSDEKKAKDVLFKPDGSRRRLFYPFDPSIDPNKLSVAIDVMDTYTLDTKSTRFKFGLKHYYRILIDGVDDERITSWDDIYRIKERYQKNLAASESEWFSHLVEEYKEALVDGICYTRFKEKLLSRTKRELLVSEKGIIKNAYYTYLLNLPDIEEDLSLYLRGIA